MKPKGAYFNIKATCHEMENREGSANEEVRYGNCDFPEAISVRTLPENQVEEIHDGLAESRFRVKGLSTQTPLQEGDRGAKGR